eukprot:Clim_evm25s251 gene=Clim_evmTU25s251
MEKLGIAEGDSGTPQVAAANVCSTKPARPGMAIPQRAPMKTLNLMAIKHKVSTQFEQSQQRLSMDDDETLNDLLDSQAEVEILGDRVVSRVSLATPCSLSANTLTEGDEYGSVDEADYTYTDADYGVKQGGSYEDAYYEADDAKGLNGTYNAGANEGREPVAPRKIAAVNPGDDGVYGDVDDHQYDKPDEDGAYGEVDDIAAKHEYKEVASVNGHDEERDAYPELEDSIGPVSSIVSSTHAPSCTNSIYASTLYEDPADDYSQTEVSRDTSLSNRPLPQTPMGARHSRTSSSMSATTIPLPPRNPTLTKLQQFCPPAVSRSASESSMQGAVKVSTKIYTTPTYGVPSLLRESDTASTIIRQFVHDGLDPKKNWAMQESIPALGLVRVIEDHENIAKIGVRWPDGNSGESTSHIRFLMKDYEKKFKLPDCMNSWDESLPNYIEACTINRLQKDGKFKKRHIKCCEESGSKVLYNDKGKGKFKELCDLSELIIYHTIGFKERMGAPTDRCLVLVPNSTPYTLRTKAIVLCFEDEYAMNNAVAILRRAKYGRQIAVDETYHQSLQSIALPTHVTHHFSGRGKATVSKTPSSSSAGVMRPDAHITGSILADRTASRTGSDRAAKAANHKFEKKHQRNMSRSSNHLAGNGNGRRRK